MISSSIGVRLFLRRILAIGLLGGIAACSSGDGDPPSASQPNPLGDGKRVREVVDPSLKVTGTVYITGAEVTTVDTFDETKDGKSIGTIYVQDADSSVAFSATSLYSPSFVPGDLRVAPGDVIDLRGPYTELQNIGSAVFNPGQVLPQISRPVATFRYETALPAPVVIDVNELNDYDKGRKWMNMLVTVKNPSITGAFYTDKAGRVTAPITSDTANRNAATMSNELYDLKADSIPVGTQLKSLTGIVTWFFSYHIAPRSPADIVR